MHHSDFIGLLSSIYKPKIYVELGLFEGETWNKVTPSCQEAYGVDIIDRNIKGNIFIGTTDDFFKQFNKKIDMVFIDADHRYESCKKDFLNSLKLINEGGIIIMHDTDPNNNNLFDEGYCGDSYKIVDFLEDHMKDEINVLTLPLTEAGLSIISKKEKHQDPLKESMMINMQRMIDIYQAENLPDPHVIFEIGAREANDSAFFKDYFPNADVYAFEAHPGCFDKNKNNNNLKNINYYNIAMWDKKTTLEFHDKNADSGISSFRDRGQAYGSNTFKLETMTPFDFCTQRGINIVDILKLDVEGCSYEILKGFNKLLKNIKFIHIETERVEYFKGQKLEKDVFKILLENNFKMLEHSHCCLEQYDSVWTYNG